MQLNTCFIQANFPWTISCEIDILFQCGADLYRNLWHVIWFLLDSYVC
jgi:hypothetical protein